MHRISYIVAALMVLLAIALQAIAQPPFERREAQAPLESPVEVAVRIEAGSAWTYHFGLNQTSTRQKQTEDRQDDGPLLTSLLIQNATVSLRVTEIDEETGTATVEATFDRLLTILGDDDGQREFRWAAGDQKREQSTDLGRLLAALTGSTLTAKVSSRGSVRGVVGYDEVNAVLEEYPEADSVAMGLFAPAAIRSTLELIWKPGEVSGASRNVQDTWESDRRASLGAVGGVAVSQALTVDRIEEGVLTATGKASMRSLPPREAAGAGVPTIDVLMNEGRMKISWDLNKGCAASASERLDIGAFWTLGGAHLGMTMRSERSAALDVPPAENRKPGAG